MNKPKIIKLDLNDCKSILELHERIKETFDFPDYYGRNWDAFWDLLSEPDDYSVLEIIGLKDLSEQLQTDVEIMLTLLEENKVKWDEFMKEHPSIDCRFEYQVID